MVKQIDKTPHGVVVVVAHAIAHVFGQVNGQRPVRTEQARAVNRHARRDGPAAGLDLGNLARRERHRGFLADAHTVIARSHRAPKSWFFRIGALELSQRRVEIVRVGLFA